MPYPTFRAINAHRASHVGSVSLAGILCLALVLGLSIGCSSSKKKTAPIDISMAKFVGRSSCITCHKKEAELFNGSHHDKAMELATDETVLADFDDAEVEHHTVKSRFFRDGKRFMVHTEGPDGQMTDFEVKYVFGLEPLQQYMVELPSPGSELEEGALPRVQVLRLCWNTEKKEWFYLPPPDVPEKLAPDDDLHWTGIAQRWNTMCAECHSTNYQKRFTVPESHTTLVALNRKEDDGAYASQTRDIGHYNSTFVEIDVSCETCHGPGSVHVELAKQWFPGWSRERGYGLANLKATAENQIQSCAPCHSRRNVIASGFHGGDNYYDHYTNQLLTAGVYYPDGQILDEDYVHGSFIQSKMYHKGIKCSDCHDPHTARLKYDGNQVCTSCHQHPTAKYDSVNHHFHKPDGEGAKCVNCHMPATTYMAVDPRRDHSLRVPRPDISLKIGTPNACTGCHLERENTSETAREDLPLYQDWMLAAREGDSVAKDTLARIDKWCDDACEKWYGETRRKDEHYGLAIAAAQNGDANATELLEAVLAKKGFEAPALARATALQELLSIAPSRAASEAERLIKDEHPLVRHSAASALVGTTNPSKSVGLLEVALKDSARSVRTEAARNLLNFPSSLWSKSSSASFRNALDELTSGLAYSNDRSGAHLTLGILAEQQGRDQQAIRHYESAVGVEPGVTGPRTNLARLLERNLELQRNKSGQVSESLLEQIKQLRLEELGLLRRDMNLLPDNAPIQYRYGLALYLNREWTEDVDATLAKASEHLVTAAELDTSQPQYAQAAAMLFQHRKRWTDALQWGREGVRRSNNDPSYVQLLNTIQLEAAQSQ